MFYKRKRVDVSTTKQTEDRFSRFDYNLTNIGISSGIRGGEEDILDDR